MAEFYLKSNGWPVDQYLTERQAVALYAQAVTDPHADLVGGLGGGIGFLYLVDHVPGIGDVLAHVRPISRERIPPAALERLEREAADGG